MLKKLFIFIFLLSVAALPSFAGTLNHSGRAGIYTPTVAGASPSLMYGLGADYTLNDNLSVRAAVETTSYSAGGNNYTLTPITVDLIYRQTFVGMVTPYVGAGLGYYGSTVNGNTKSTTGAQAEAGLSFSMGGFTAGLELRYILPDASNSASGAFTTNGYATGGFSQSFNL